MDKNRPETVIRDGALKASIWRNESENGPFFSTSLARTYKDEKGELRDTGSFSGSELLRVAELAREAYARSNELRREHAQSQSPEHEEAERDQAREQFKAHRGTGRQRDSRQLRS